MAIWKQKCEIMHFGTGESRHVLTARIIKNAAAHSNRMSLEMSDLDCNRTSRHYQIELNCTKLYKIVYDQRSSG